MAYTTLERAKAHLNIAPEFTDDDALIQSYIDAAEMLVELDVRMSQAQIEERYGGDVPAPLRQAVLLQVGSFYASREDIAFGVIVSKTHAYDRLIQKFIDYEG